MEALFKDDSSMMPSPKLNKKAKYKDIQWNQRAIKAELLQGFIQGESIDKVAKRIQKVQKMNYNAAVRYARTMATNVSTAGREQSIKDNNDIGIIEDPAWLATLDMKTRDSHRRLDGEVRNRKTGKFSNGLTRPGDPSGKPSEVYNCRCDLVGQIEGLEHDFSDLTWREHRKLGNMTYDEWKKGHKKKDHQR